MPEKDEGMSLDEVRRLAEFDQIRAEALDIALPLLKEYQEIFHVPDPSAAIPAGSQALLARGAISVLIGEILMRKDRHAREGL